MDMLKLELNYHNVREDEDFVLVVDDENLPEGQAHVIECRDISAHALANRLLELPDNEVIGSYLSIVSQIVKGWDKEDKKAIGQQKALT